MSNRARRRTPTIKPTTERRSTPAEAIDECLDELITATARGAGRDPISRTRIELVLPTLIRRPELRGLALDAFLKRRQHGGNLDHPAVVDAVLDLASAVERQLAALR